MFFHDRTQVEDVPFEQLGDFIAFCLERIVAIAQVELNSGGRRGTMSTVSDQIEAIAMEIRLAAERINGGTK